MRLIAWKSRIRRSALNSNWPIDGLRACRRP
ncbi:hypothetical protein GCK32_022600 [Trichostrongylus colubriformis]|uniref:Uncharacterized protein n=1 Tax=Trichostrongylus colubriformis TaxID=6319 RepID=A0AAN8FN15_TRICO